MKKLYLFLHFSTLSLLAVGVFAFFIVSSSYFVPFMAEKYLKEYGVKYSDIKGSIFHGISLSNVEYGGFLKVKHLEINYYLVNLIRATPKITSLKVDTLELNIDKLPKADNNSTQSTFMAFAIKKIEFKNSKIIFNKERILFNTKMKAFHYDERIDVDKFLLDLKSSYGDVSIDAKIVSSRVMGDISIKATEKTHQEYLAFIGEVPEYLKVKIDVTQKKAVIITHIDSLNLAADSNVRFENIDAKVIYSFDEKSIESDLLYRFLYPDYVIDVNQSLLYRNDTKYTTKIEATLEKQAFSLPFKQVYLQAHGDSKSLESTLNAGETHVDVSSKDYKKFNVHAKSDSFSLAFLETLPQTLQKEVISFEANTTVEISPLQVEGTINTENAYSQIKSHVKLSEQAIKVRAEIDPKIKNEFFHSHQVELVTPMKLFVNVNSKDYRNYVIDTKSDAFTLALTGISAEKIQEEIRLFKSHLAIDTVEKKVVGSLSAEDLYAKIDARVKLSEEVMQVKAEINPKIENEIFDGYPMELITPLNVLLEQRDKTQKLKLNANLLNLTLLHKEDELSGFGNLASAKFSLKSKIEHNSIKEMHLKTNIASLRALLLSLKLADKNDLNYEDAQIDVNSTLNFSEKFQMKNSISIPWLSLKTDSQTTHLIKNIMLSTRYEDKNITLYNYSAEYMEYKFYSDKASSLSIDDKQNIVFDEFWVYDNILVKGKVEPSEKSAKFDIHSDRFNYLAEDINVSARVDAQAVFDKNITQKIDANVTLIEGFVSYVPPNDYKITDKDIIIVQDIKPEDNFPLALNVNLNTQKSIRYKTKEIDVEFIPKLRVVQEPNQSLRLLGQITVLDGMLTTTGKEFKIDESYIYFEGEEELNPKINLHLHYYTLDYIDIEIFITNTLNEPVIIFSSKPAMSQNDIMSYILFGEPASSLFDNSQGGNKTSINALLLGAGLKQMFSETSGINVDTLNIIDSKDGTLGYEVGARFNKNMRVVYKSDTASSIVLQYSITQSIRFDIDSHETGQGVAFTYVKDFTIR